MTEPLSSTLLAQCQWPDLPARYDAALREAVAWIVDRYPDVVAIMACGTIIRGEPRPTSDLDIYVVRREPYRQRVQRRFRDVPAEIFVNPAHQVHKYLADEQQAGRVITAHMLATGFVVLAVDDTLAQLRAAACRSLAASPAWDAQRLTVARYMAVCRYEDATDVAADRPAAASMILALAVHDMLAYRFLQADRYLPRDKDLLCELDAFDPALAAPARAFYAAPDLARRLALAEQLADAILETRGFFPWASDPEHVPPDNVQPEVSLSGSG